MAPVTDPDIARRMAQASARQRRTLMVLRRIDRAGPVTREQRDRIVAAAQCIAVVDPEATR